MGKFLRKDKKGKSIGKDTHAIVTGPKFDGKKTVNSGPNRQGLDEFQARIDRYLYHLIVNLGYPLKAATFHVAWRAIAYDQYPLPRIELFDDPEHMVRVSYYKVTTGSSKWADPEKPEYAGRYYFEVMGEKATLYCPTFANVSPPDTNRPAPPGLRIYFSDNIEKELTGKSPDTVIDGITVSSHRRLQQCARFIITALYELNGDVKAMRIALYKFMKRITLNTRNASGAFRSRSPFLIIGVESAVYLNQKFTFGNVIDDFPMSSNRRLFTGACLGPMSEEQKKMALHELNDAFRTFGSFTAAITFVTMYVDSMREVAMDEDDGDAEDDTALFEVLHQWCDHDDLDSSHTCKSCGDILRCDEVAREIEGDVICTTCFGSDHATDNQEASQLL
ncbi:hypothetical protein QFC22_001213 [Naganishia vaughanmartiniae]|uniref:Uncharacterized protein n=1 Tax=Naganishia vaughanmartiniae TaxID=1424756 RepID=A0ACC2XNY6_9TREE|nr:hypothetical protein QFC22_001213 [Naganishia vaughanmartiniae]